MSELAKLRDKLVCHWCVQPDGVDTDLEADLALFDSMTKDAERFRKIVRFQEHEDSDWYSEWNGIEIKLAGILPDHKLERTLAEAVDAIREA